VIAASGNRLQVRFVRNNDSGNGHLGRELRAALLDGALWDDSELTDKHPASAGFFVRARAS